MNTAKRGIVMPTRGDHARFYAYLIGETEPSDVNNSPLTEAEVESLLDDPCEQLEQSFLASAIRGFARNGGLIVKP